VLRPCDDEDGSVLGTGERGDEELETDCEGERLVRLLSAEWNELVGTRAALEHLAVRDGAHRHVGDDGGPAQEGIAIASGFVPVRGEPPSGCGSRRGEVAVNAATSPPSARRRTQYPSAPVGKQRLATTTRA